MKNSLFKLSLTVLALTFSACEAEPESVSYGDGGITSMGDTSETGSEGGDSASGSGSGGSTTGDGDGDGDGDGPEPVGNFMPCDPMEMQAGDNYCLDGPRDPQYEDSPIVQFTCVNAYSGVSPGPGFPPVGGFFCLPLHDRGSDGTGLTNPCDKSAGGNEHFAGCLNLSCMETQYLPFDYCRTTNPIDPTPMEEPTRCCTTFCNSDVDCAPGLRCYGGNLNTVGSCLETFPNGG